MFNKYWGVPTTDAGSLRPSLYPDRNMRAVALPENLTGDQTRLA